METKRVLSPFPCSPRQLGYDPHDLPFLGHRSWPWSGLLLPSNEGNQNCNFFFLFLFIFLL